MQGFMSKHKLRLLQRQPPNVLGIVVKRSNVGAYGLAAFRLGRSHGQPQHQRAEERPVQDQAGARCTELGFDFVGHQ